MSQWIEYGTYAAVGSACALVLKIGNDAIDGFYNSKSLILKTEALQGTPSIYSVLVDMEQFCFVDNRLFEEIVTGLDRLVHIYNTILANSSIRTIKTQVLGHCIYKKATSDVQLFYEKSKSSTAKAQVRVHALSGVLLERSTALWEDFVKKLQRRD